MLKRLSEILLVVALAAVVLTGCAQQPAPTPDPGPTEVKVYQGLGRHVIFRTGPGKDATDTQVYSFNYTYADATFDAEGRILNVFVDILEVATPNYDGDGMAHFPGWPGIEGYNNFDHETGAISGPADTSPEAVAAAVNGWVTKRDRGLEYHMNPNNEWFEQMNYFQELFKGMTIPELEAWVAKFTSDRNGRPLAPNSSNELDAAKFSKLTAEEQAYIVDVRTGATMSVNDAHGDIIAAIKDAFENRVEVVIPIPGK